MALENITRHIILDVSVHKYVAVVIKQYDKNIREIIVKVTDNGKPYPIDSTIQPRIKCKKSDNTYIVNDCTVLDDGDVQIDVTEQMTTASGICDYELVLFDAATDKILHTMNFIINVKKAVFSDEEITSTNEFKSFEEGLLKVDQMTQVVDEVKQLIEGDTFIRSDQKGKPNGIATLNENGLIPSSQLPSYVDDVLDGTYDEANNQFLDLDGNVYTPESDKIYVDVNTSITYRWSGTVYVEIGGGYIAITDAEIDELFA